MNCISIKAKDDDFFCRMPGKYSVNAGFLEISIHDNGSKQLMYSLIGFIS